MRIKYLSALFLIVSQFFPCAYAREIVLAFDNTLARSTSLDGSARTKMLINSMARADVKQAVFLIKSKTIFVKNTPNVVANQENKPVYQ